MTTTGNLSIAINLAKKLAAESGKETYVIYVYGKGYKEVPNHFVLDRQYFHDSSGQKMFFASHCKVSPDGEVVLFEHAKDDKI